MNINSKMKGIVYTMMLALVFSMTACGGDDDDDNNDGVGGAFCAGLDTNIEKAVEAYSEALSNFISDQTLANCQAYFAAFSDYVDVLEEAIDCYPTADQAAAKQAFDQLRAQLEAEDPCEEL